MAKIILGIDKLFWFRSTTITVCYPFHNYPIIFLQKKIKNKNNTENCKLHYIPAVYCTIAPSLLVGQKLHYTSFSVNPDLF